jgi:hypothetical protein
MLVEYRVLSSKRQQRHIPGTFNCLFRLSLTAGTIAAALAGVYLAAVGQKLLQSLDVLVVNVFYASSAKTTLRLLTSTHKARLSSPASVHIPSGSHFASHRKTNPASSLHCSHLLPYLVKW